MMTLSELIASEPANASRTDEEILAWLQEPSGYFEEAVMNARSLMARVGAVRAARILDALEAAASLNSAVKWSISFLTAGDGIDLGHPETRAQIQALAGAGVLTAEDRDLLLGLPRSIARWELAADWRDPAVERARALHDIASARAV